jgi:hypothetical protein
MEIGFRTHPDRIRQLAQEFRAAATDLEGAVPGFQGNVLEVGEAFGLLGVCTGAASQYLTMVDHTVDGLQKLVEMMLTDAEGLEYNASLYEDTDQHNSRLMGGN